MRNITTTHLLDAVAAEFGETCHEAPVGFKHISGKMLETGAVIGGRAPGGGSPSEAASEVRTASTPPRCWWK